MATYLGRVEEFQSEDDSWESYAERMGQFYEANGVTDEKKKVAILLTSIGAKSYQELKDMAAPTKPSELKFDEINAYMSTRFEPETTVILCRFRFHNRKQSENEDISSFVSALRRLASKCSYGAFYSDAVRDQLVCGLRDPATQKKLLSTDKLDLEKAIMVARTMETAGKDSKEMSKTTHEPVHQVKGPELKSGRIPECYCCGVRGHKKPDCPQLRETCSYCGIQGHMEKMCLKKKKKKFPTRKKKFGKKAQKTSYVDASENSDESTYQVQVNTMNSQDKPIVVTMKIEGKMIDMEVDTGAKKSIMSEQVYNTLGRERPALLPTESVLKTYSGERITPRGVVTVKVSYNSQHKSLPLIIAPGDTTTLLGRDWLSELKLDWPSLHDQWAEVNKVNVSVLDDFPDLFKPKSEVKLTVSLTVDPSVPPKFCKARPLPFALRSKVEEELERLEKAGTISPVNTSTWASPIVPVIKTDGSVRICGDYKVAVNGALKSDVYPLPTPDDLFAALAGSKVYSKLDMKNAYLQLPLSEESREIVTINTHKGLFSYNSLPFGVSSAPSVFQRTLEGILGGVPGVSLYLDDVLVCGGNQDEHDGRLKLVLQKLSDAGLRLKREKCEISVPSVMYLGHKVSEQGVEVLQDKVQAIAEAPAPSNKQQLQSWIGMVTYYDKFLPNLSTVLEPLHKLLRKNVEFKWSDKQETAFKKCKVLLQTSPVLCHYDPTKPLILTVDSSAYGLGAVLSHKLEDGEHAIAYKSRKLNAAERNYGQVDKEALAIAFGLSKFHKYVYGRHFTIVTDHKPLLGLLGEGKKIPEITSPRLQRFALKLSAFSYDLVHKPGKSIANADGLSRLPMNCEPRKESVPGEIIMSMDIINTSPVSVDKVRSWTDKDPVMSKVKEFVRTGKWPIVCEWEEMKPYASRKYELSIEEGVIMWGSRVVIPPRGREKLLDELHFGHPGASRMKGLARSYVWWPKCDADIEGMVQKCTACQQQRQMPAAPPLHPWEYPERPWSRIHLDYAGPFLGKMFLVIVDAFSKWVEIHVVEKASSSATILKCRETFAIHGLPEIMVSDNGTCFTSSEFQSFVSECGVKHIKSAPYHPATNGLAENAVKSFKRSIKKMHVSGSVKITVAKYLLQQHITPHTVTGQTPAELLMKRRLRSRLDVVKPDLSTTVRKKQRAQKLNYDKRAISRKFELEDTVFCKNHASKGDKWLQCVIVAQSGPVSFLVELTDGRIVRRHVSQLIHRDEGCVMLSEKMFPDQELHPEGPVMELPCSVQVPQDASSDQPLIAPQDTVQSSNGMGKPPTADLPAAKPVESKECAPAPRRSARSTKGIPPAKYRD